ncbi:MAG: family transcriptional regulator [Aeromicrobium sp.]|jgi:transcriptional regulator with XRE-family HTH domain|nr:family transcriptional regulator [Aeromicrobium sp.]
MADSLDDTSRVLDGVGPRLRALRTARGATLAELSADTGISVSTLSRLEAGQRRPTLELLLQLSRVHQVPLDELVDAPETGDPRVRAKPFVRHGRTFIPLTRRPGGVQAFKIVIPPHDPREPYRPQVHEGYEWIYVLSGRLHLVLDRREIDLGPGEVVEFDTRTPHVVANRGDIPAEILGLFGPQGERMHVRSGQ